MSSEEPPARRVLPKPGDLPPAPETRERVIEALSTSFAHDALDVAEFERRVTVAHTSESGAEIEALTADLEAPVAGVAIVPARVALAPPAEVEPVRTVQAILSGVDRSGGWTVPRRMRVLAAMGGVRLDLREARFPAGVVDIDIRAFCGGVQIVVPPGLAVEMHGTAILGGFAQMNRSPARPDSETPRLRVGGVAILGGVEVTTALPDDLDAKPGELGPRRAPRRLGP